MTAREPGDVAATYFDAWLAKDFDALRGVLADGVTFRGPLGQANGPDECLAGLRGLRELITDIVVRHRWVDGPEVVTWFDLHTTASSEPSATVNWSHVEDGRITAIRVTFDPRPLLGEG